MNTYLARKLKRIYDAFPPNFYESSHILRGIYHLQRYSVAKQYLRSLPGLILDVGCNGGLFTNLLLKEGKRVVGLDISSSFLHHTRKLREADFVLADAQLLPFRDNTFDGASCLEVLEHLIMPEMCVREIFRVLKPRGKAIFLVPNEKYPLYKIIWSAWRRWGKGYCWNGLHLRAFDKRILYNMLSSNGFSVEAVCFCNLGMLLVAKAIKRGE
jgi:ubiquinone/menaquinone biosynthesis C-methylase UbiE